MTYHHSHGQLNAGTFNLYWRGEAYIDELEEFGYPDDYWDVDRWKYPYASSEGKNVITVNGQPQWSGKGRGGIVEDFETADDHAFARLNPTGAYPDGTLENWQRLLLLDKPDVAVVLDYLSVELGSEIRSRFHSAVEIEWKGNHALLKGKHGMMALIPLASEVLDLATGAHDVEELRRAIPPQGLRDSEPSEQYLDILLTNQAEDVYLETILVPVENPEEAGQIAASAYIRPKGPDTVKIGFTRKGEVFEYDLEPSS